MSLTALNRRVAAINDVLCAASLLNWDASVMMPPGGASTRGHQLATLTRIARDMLCADATLRALDRAEAAVAGRPDDDADRRAAAHVRRAVDFHRRVPADLVERRAALEPVAHAAWVEARARNDYSLFAPHLATIVDLARAYAEAIGYEAHPCDALIGLYEPGETMASLAPLFARLTAGLKPILDHAQARPRPRRDFLARDYPQERQRDLALRFAQGFGYDLSRGRLDPTVHPFEVSFTRNDVRITTRYDRRDATQALFGTFHETGHGLYEQNVDPALTRGVFATDLVSLYAIGGTSYGAHESQSRLFENHVGRSRAFWALHFGTLREAFPEALADVDADAFYAAVSHVEPGPIRTDADEMTYDFHIALRIEIEAALIGGELAVADVPDAWRSAMRRHLGIDVADDAQGCLQDVHWSGNGIGAFCTYTIGNVMAAQLMQAAQAQDGTIAAGIAHADYAPLGAWLRDNIWRHGRRYSRDELLVRATGRKLDTAPYLAYLAAKYGAGG